MLDRATQSDSKKITEADKSYYAPAPAVSLFKGYLPRIEGLSTRSKRWTNQTT
jgi:hypothetical protein